MSNVITELRSLVESLNEGLTWKSTGRDSFEAKDGKYLYKLGVDDDVDNPPSGMIFWAVEISDLKTGKFVEHISSPNFKDAKVEAEKYGKGKSKYN